MAAANLGQCQAEPNEGDMSQLTRVALAGRIPLDVIKQAHELFVGCCEEPPKLASQYVTVDGVRRKVQCDPIQEGFLTPTSFALVLCRLSGCPKPENLEEGLLWRCFQAADVAMIGILDFPTFCIWFSRHGFTEAILLSREQREIREMARKYKLPVVEVEQYKMKFDLADEDRSGAIEYEEFERLLSNIIKVPGEHRLPPARVKQFFVEADVDGNGLVDFEEFLLFYLRYFGADSGGRSPFETYYRSLRPVPVRLTNSFMNDP